MSEDQQAGGAAGPVINNMMMVPWFLGGPWVPKYGEKNGPPLAEWRSQMEIYLRAQTLSAEQEVDFILSALQGEAKREVLLLPPAEKDTADHIFEALGRIYGDAVTVSQLRAQFFKCQQQAGEGVGPFILRLRESHSRWRAKEPTVGSDDEMLRSQLVLGLQPGPVQMELQRRARREPTLAFDEACKEAKAMEKETQQAHAPMDVETRRTYNSPTQPQPSHGSKSSTDPLQDWGSLKEAMRTELVEELRAQVNDMKTSLLAELRTQRTAPGPTPRQPDPASNNSSHPQGTRPRRRDRTPQWDDQGRPICLRCGQAGHMQRNCVSQGSVDHRRVASSADGSSPAEAPMKTALVGQCPEVEVLVQGKRFPCILDTGSQVTLFSRGLLKQHLGDIEMKDTKDVPWLTLKAANGLALPYVGYALLDFEVGGIAVRGKGVVVVEDHYLPPTYGVLGMNVIQYCWEGLRQQGGHQFTLFKSTLPRAATVAWDRAFAACRRLRAEECRGPSLGVARLRTAEPVRLAPQTETAVWAHVPEVPRANQESVLLEDCYHGAQEWCVGRAVANLQDGRVLLRVCNPHPYPVELPPRRPLARVLRLSQEDIQVPNQLVLRREDETVVEVDVCPVSSALPDHLASLVHQAEDLAPLQRRQLEGLLGRWQGTFAQSEEDYGCTDVVYHTIPTGDAAPIRQRYRPVPPSLYAELRTLLQGMLEGGVIRESSSPWASPVVLVRKKDQSWRFCVDYRKLNEVTHKDAFPLPRVEETLTCLKRAEWYSTLDLASGYWQVEVHPSDKEKTAFATPVGLYQFERMPFGLCNAPATFQRLMQRCLGGQVHDFLLIYLDDVIIYSPDFDSHLEHLGQVFLKLQDHGLKLQPSKCRLLQKSVKYLGHVVGGGGVATDPSKTQAVQQWPVPTTVREVRSFLGFVGYYRRFIPAFAQKASPLHALLRGTGGHKTRSIKWTSDCERAFSQLKQALVKAPVLAYADFTLPFRLYTDASLHGLGAVLAQVQGGRERVIAYGSRSLHDAEKQDQNYSAFKLELLALKWAVTDKFKDYLWGATFQVFTDHRPLLHLRTAKLGAVEQRWVAQLDNFDFSLCHKRALSRLPEALLAGRVEAPTNGGTQEVWAERQGSDPDLTLIRRWQQQGHEPSAVERQTLQLAGRQLLREWPNLTVMEGVLLCKRPASGALGEVTAVVVPVADRRQVWTRYREALGHAKGYRLLAALRERVFWNGMNRDNRRWVRECTQCCLNSNVEGPRAPLCSIDSSYPWETLALDYLSLNRAGDRYPYILVIVDLFSRFAFAVPTKDQTAPTTAGVLWTTVFQSFGCPERILTDQGPAFEAELTQQLCGLYGCHKVRTTPYHPQGNGACERMNQTILGLLNTLSQREQGRWMEHLPELTHAYNNTPHSVTGLAPFFVLFGRHARLPVDQLMGVHRSEWRGNTLEWIGEHHGRLTSAYQLVRQGTQQRQQQDQRRHNRGRRALPLLPGERVLVRDFRRRGRGKLGYHWDPRPYVVLNQPSADRPVYTLRPEGREGPTRTIHRNHLRVQPADWGDRSGTRGDAGEVAGERRVEGPELGWWPVGLPVLGGEPGSGGTTMMREGMAPELEEGALSEEEAGSVSGARRSQRPNLGVRPARYRE
ncbi:uncharacterized protein LOC121720042 [Alosa sapidissima]|uniref:uncharacterized protein LOC121720042 n=1 Tax=Alosa sapidissima TaxID=34773 RepID=UPI001C093D6E|nr:uncharacterized protein LOC121720042 [Alosa sapidissima]